MENILLLKDYFSCLFFSYFCFLPHPFSSPFLHFLSFSRDLCPSPLFIILWEYQEHPWHLKVPWLTSTRNLRCLCAKSHRHKYMLTLNWVYAHFIFRKLISVMWVRKQNFQTNQKSLKPERLNSRVWTLYMDTMSIPKVYCNSRLHNNYILILKSMLNFNICTEKETQQTRWGHSTSYEVMRLVLHREQKTTWRTNNLEKKKAEM